MSTSVGVAAGLAAMVLPAPPSTATTSAPRGPAASAPAACAPVGTERCLPVPGGPRCFVWTGRVTGVSDGDTIRVDLDGDGTRASRRVRIAGIQAMEQTVYSRYPWRRRGECHSLRATARLEQLVRASRGRVRVTAQWRTSVSGARLRRHVAVRLQGQWRDAGHALVLEGHALWLSQGVEWAWNAHYRAAARLAAAARRGIWRPWTCGRGPAPGAVLRIRVRPDPPGRDAANLNGEYVTISNRGPVAVPLRGWWVRDSSLRRYRFPAGVRLAPGGVVRLHVGWGRDRVTARSATLHWRQPRPVFDNPSGPPRHIGDGAYLFDPHGDLRAWQVYPCGTVCVSG